MRVIGRRIVALRDFVVRVDRDLPALAALIGIAALVGLDLWLRTRGLWAKLWIDEGLSIGIAHHPFGDIPAVLRQDGAPPLYYLLLNVWMSVVGGDGEARTHALSLGFALAAVPVSWAAGRLIFGRRSAWVTAVLTATIPFLTYYAQETRMYALVVLLSLIAAGSFTLVFAQRRRAWLPVFAVFGAALPYTHNWGLFALCGCGLAWLTLIGISAAGDERRGLIGDGLIGFGAVALLYAPWLPTLLGQAAHTGAPWAESPSIGDLVNVLQVTLGAGATALAIALIAGTGLMRTRGGPYARSVWVLLTIALAAPLLAFVLSQVSPAWAGRYVAVSIGPVLLLSGAGLARAGRLGLVCLLVVFMLWFDPQEHRVKGKSDAFRVARSLRDGAHIAQGDTVIVVHPEQTPVMRYYLGDGLRWADALGPVRDPWVFDWRDAQTRFEQIGPRAALRRILPRVERGQNVIAIHPLIRTGGWGAPWTALVRKRSAQWAQTLDHDERLERLGAVPEFRNRLLPRGVRAVVYRRR